MTPVGASSSPTSASIADYIFDLSGELTVLAEHAQFRLLAYLLDMVRVEADLMRKQARRSDDLGAPAPHDKRA